VLHSEAIQPEVGIETPETRRPPDSHSIASGALLPRLLPLLRPGDSWVAVKDSHEYFSLSHGMFSGYGFARLINGVLRSPGYLPVYQSVILLMTSLSTTTLVQIRLRATSHGLREGPIVQYCLCQTKGFQFAFSPRLLGHPLVTSLRLRFTLSCYID